MVYSTACQTGRYGDTCHLECNCENNTNHCDPETGETTDCVCVSGYHKFDGVCITG